MVGTGREFIALQCGTVQRIWRPGRGVLFCFRGEMAIGFGS